MTDFAKIQIIQTVDQLEQFASQWSKVAGKNGSICRLHQWTLAWWQAFGGNMDSNSLHTIVVSDEQNQPQLIAPMMICQKTYRRVPVLSLQFAANGHSPSSGIIYNQATKNLSPLLQTLIEYLTTYKEWDLVDLHKMNTEDPVFDEFVRLTKAHTKMVGTQTSLESPYVPVEGEWDDFLKSRSSKFRKVMRNKINRMNRASNLSVQRLSLGNNDEHPPFNQILSDMVSVSKRSWKKELGRDLETDTNARTFYHELLHQFGPSAMIDVWFFWQDKEPLAFEFHLKHDGVLYPIRADMDASIKDFSPGSLLEHTILKEHFEKQEIREYNSCGSTYEYLLKWTDKTRLYKGVQLFKPSWKGRALFTLEYKLMPRVRKWRGKGSSDSKGNG